MRVSIHQPNFVPWYPFFQKIKEVDKFIILKECQFEKNGYQNRFNFNEVETELGSGLLDFYFYNLI